MASSWNLWKLEFGFKNVTKACYLIWSDGALYRSVYGSFIDYEQQATHRKTIGKDLDNKALMESFLLQRFLS